MCWKKRTREQKRKECAGLGLVGANRAPEPNIREETTVSCYVSKV